MIPATFDEAVDELLKNSDICVMIADCMEDDYHATFSTRNHFTLGRWIRNTWGLNTGCGACPVKDAPLYYWFYERGLWHPDDMSSVIMDAAFNRYQGLDFDLDTAILSFQSYWNNMEREKWDAINHAVENVLVSHDV